MYKSICEYITQPRLDFVSPKHQSLESPTDKYADFHFTPPFGVVKSGGA